MKRLLVTVAVGFLAATTVSAQWAQTGPPGGAVNALRASGRHVYAAGRGGLMVSDDRGLTWSRLLSLPDAEMTLLQVDPLNPETIFLIASRYPSYFGSLFIDTQLLKSTNAGLSWQELRAGLPTQRSVVSLAVDAGNPSVLYAALQCGVQYFKTAGVLVTPGAGIYKSTDGGDTWVQSTSGLSGEDLCARGIAVDPAVPGNVYAFSETLISSWVTKHSRSTNGGLTWTTSVDPNQPARDLVAHPSGRRFAIAAPTSCSGCASTSALVTSTDGETWEVIAADNGRDRVLAFAIDPESDRRIYLVRDSGLYVTNDLGATWSALASGFDFQFARTVAVDPADRGLLYLGTSRGLFVSHDAGVTWSRPEVPLVGTSPSELAVGPGGTLYAILQDFDLPRTVVRSTDGGRTWLDLGALSTTPSSVAWWAGGRPTMTVTADGTLYALSGESPAALKRFDGTQWQTVSLPPGVYVDLIVADPGDASTLYAAGYPDRVLKTTDRGATWSVIASRVGGVWRLAVAPTVPTTLYLAYGGALDRSSDGGNSWTKILDRGQVYGIALTPGHPATVYAYTCCHDGLLRSDDSGTTWTQLRGFEDARGVLVDPRNTDVVYLRFLGGGILRSPDRGATWAPFSGGLMSHVVNDFVGDPGTGRVYAATFRAGVHLLTQPTRRHAAR